MALGSTSRSSSATTVPSRSGGPPSRVDLYAATFTLADLQGHVFKRPIDSSGGPLWGAYGYYCSPAPRPRPPRQPARGTPRLRGSRPEDPRQSEKSLRLEGG